MNNWTIISSIIMSGIIVFAISYVFYEDYLNEDKDIESYDSYYFVVECLIDEGVYRSEYLTNDISLFTSYLEAYSKLNNCVVIHNSLTY